MPKPMKDYTRSSGVKIRLPETCQLQTESVRKRGTLRTAAAAPESDPLLAALQQQDLQVLDSLMMLPAPEGAAPARPLRRGAPAPTVPPKEAAIEVDLGPQEEALVLTEQDGYYHWQLPQPVETPPAPAAPVRRTRGGAARGAPPAPPRRVRFTVSLTPAAGPAPAGGPKRRGLLAPLGQIAGQWIKAHVLKFAAGLAAAALMKWLERNVQRGLMQVTSVHPADWRLVPDLTGVSLPAERRARVLLLIHGTFSSTAGSYGALGATPWGQAFLQGALASYDAVIGFNHATLSEDPRENANDLWRRLKLESRPLPPTFDVVTFSRGGLVLRYLAEELLPRLTPPIQIGRVLFVGSTLSGTELANPENWETLLDFYTNLAAGAARALSLLPSASAQTASTVLRGTVDGLGSFAKYLAAAAVTERKIPGLAAMEPKGEFIQHLNQTQLNQPAREATWYAAVTSEFEPSGLLQAIARGESSGLPRQLVLRLADGVADRLMGQANDLVVNTASMTTMDPQLGDFIKDRLEYGRNPHVFHLNYFLQPDTANALTRWLRLTQPAATTTAPTARGPVRRGIVSPLALAPGLMAPRELPARVDTDVLALPAGVTVGTAGEQIHESSPSYVVLQRFHQGRLLRYALAGEEILQAIASRNPPATAELAGFLGLHEYEESPTGSAEIKPPPAAPPPGRWPTAARAVVFEDGRVTGVVPERRAPYSLDELVGLAALAGPPKATATDTDRVRVTRINPTFARMPLLAVPAGLMESVSAAPSRGGQRATRRVAKAAPPSRGGSGAGTRADGGVKGATRGPAGRGTAKAAAPPVPAQTAECHFRAETREEWELKQAASVTVTLEREQFEEALRGAGAESTAVIDLGRKITLEFIPKLNVEPAADTETELEVDPPGIDAPVLRKFRFTPLEPGEGEIWIVAWQRQQPLVTLRIKFKIVAPGTAGAKRMVRAEAGAAEVPAGAKPVDRLTIIELQVGNRLAYRYELDSPSLGRNWVFVSDQFQRDRAEFIDGIYRKIEEYLPRTAADEDLFQENLQVYGGELLDQLMPPDLQAVLWENREKFKSIHVFSEEPFIPWEILHLKPKDGVIPNDLDPLDPSHPKTWFLGQLGLVRWLHNTMLPPEILRVRKDRARYLIPPYADARYALPAAQEEKVFLEKQFKATACSSRPADVRRLIRGPGAFDLLHFAGHGDATAQDISGSLIWLSATPNPQPPPDPWIETLEASIVEQTANLLGAEQCRPLIVLNACRAGRTGWQLTKLGGFAKAFLARGAGLFIGALWSVGDAPARNFTEAFYAGLLLGKPVAEAAVNARETARKAKDATWLAYTVYGHPHATLVRK